MKVAVTARKPELTAELDPRFGRAAYILVVDTETGDFEALDNSENANALRGAGIQAAQRVAEKGAKALVTGHCGPNAFDALKAAGIQVAYSNGGTVKEALDAFLGGKLQTAQTPDVEGHT